MNPIQTASIGQYILKAARPRTIIPLFLLGLGVEMDHNFGSKWMISELARLGFSVIYDEVNRYKQFAALDQNLEDMVRNPFPGHFMQWVGDNVDHNLITLDGKNYFHGMGIISVSTPSSGYAVNPDSKVTRLKKVASGIFNIT